MHALRTLKVAVMCNYLSAFFSAVSSGTFGYEKTLFEGFVYEIENLFGKWN